jgi:hypothetical protein
MNAVEGCVERERFTSFGSFNESGDTSFKPKA